MYQGANSPTPKVNSLSCLLQAHAMFLNHPTKVSNDHYHLVDARYPAKVLKDRLHCCLALNLYQ